MSQWFVLVFPFICVLLRTTGIFVTAPVFGSRQMPVMLKALLSILTGYSLWVQVPTAATPQTMSGIVGSLAGEIALGLFLGAIPGALMAGIELAGQITDMELGFGMANIMDPTFGHSVPLMGLFKNTVITLMFLSLNGHHLFMEALLQSFHVVPAGAGFLPTLWASVGVDAMSKAFLIAVTLSAPIWVCILVVDIGLGFLSRSVPQMNVFAMGMPVKTMVGLGVLSVSIVFYGTFARGITESIQNVLHSLLGVLAR